MKKTLKTMLSFGILVSLLAVGCGKPADVGQGETRNKDQVSQPVENKDEQEKENTLGDYPKMPIKIVVPWDAGGGTDVFVRTMSTGAKKYLGQPLNVVNKGGAGGTIATTEFLSEKGDGYSIIFEAIGVFSTQPKMNKVSYTTDDFKPIIATSVDPIMLVTTKDSGVKTFEEFLEVAKTDEINFGYTGTGSLHHIANYALFNEIEADVNGVTYPGGGELIAAMMGDHVQYGSLHPVNIMSHKDSGAFIPLVVFSSERIEQYPDVPSIKEFGFDFEFEVWKFIAAPKDTPDDIIEFLYEGFNNILNDDEINKLIVEGGSVLIEDNRPEAVAKKLANNVEVTGKVLDDLGIGQ